MRAGGTTPSRRPVVLRLDAHSRPMIHAERAILASVNAEVLEAEEPKEDVVPEYANRIDAVMVTAKALPAAVIRKLTRCRVISRMGIGTDKIDVEQATRQGIWVTYLPGFCVEEVADHAMALLLSAARQLKESEAAMRSGRRPPVRPDISIRRLSCCTLGIVGFGRIGQAVARRARGFGLRVLVCDPARTAEEARAHEAQSAPLEAVVKQSDFVVLACPLTPQTRGMVDAALLRVMKSSSVLINVGRGGLVNESDLVDALKSGVIRCAALDVFEGVNVLGADGFSTDHPFFGLKNVLMTPHLAALSAEMIEEQRRRGAQAVVDVWCGRRPADPVNPAVRPRFEGGPAGEASG